MSGANKAVQQNLSPIGPSHNPTCKFYTTNGNELTLSILDTVKSLASVGKNSNGRLQLSSKHQ